MYSRRINVGLSRDYLTLALSYGISGADIAARPLSYYLVQRKPMFETTRESQQPGDV